MDPIIRLLVEARVKLLFDQPFFGNLSTRLNLVDATSWCKTMATDGRALYYNREFVKSLQPRELLFVVAHEVLHLVYDHIGRSEGKNKKVWNMACDYIVNYILKHESVGEMPKTGLYDTRFNDDMTADEVYQILMKNSVTISDTLDMHLECDGSDGDEEGSSGNGGTVSTTIVGGPDGPPSLTEEDKAMIRNEMRTAVINAVQNTSAGKVPAGIRRLIGELTNPIMDWRSLLEMHIQSAVKGDYTFNRPSKRSWTIGRGKFAASHRMILPGQDFQNKVDVAACIDTSGSMTDKMLRDFLSEVKGIMETFDDFTLTLWTFDTKVYNPKVFTPANIDDILSYSPDGGGGTLFESNWEFMKDPHRLGFTDMPDEIVPKKFVMFTDGYPGDGWGDPDYCDTLFVIHGSTSIVSPFGITAYYEEKS